MHFKSGIMCCLIVINEIILQLNDFSAVLAVLNKDIPSNDLVRHSLELVLHLLQQCLDLQEKNTHTKKNKYFNTSEKSNSCKKNVTRPLSCKPVGGTLRTCVISSFPDNGPEVQRVRRLLNESAAIAHFLLHYRISRAWKDT